MYLSASKLRIGASGVGRSHHRVCSRFFYRMKTLPEPEIITRKGKPVSVILPIKQYEALLERLEDAEDVAYLKKARTKPLSFRPLSEYLAEQK